MSDVGMIKGEHAIESGEKKRKRKRRKGGINVEREGIEGKLNVLLREMRGYELLLRVINECCLQPLVSHDRYECNAVWGWE